jgi:DNA-binding transcriptional regulator YhcF (GntR family)
MKKREVIKKEKKLPNINQFIEKLNVRCISVDPNYRGVKRRDYQRMLRDTKIKVKNFRYNMEKKHSDKLLQFKSEATRFIGKIDKVKMIENREDSNIKIRRKR